MATTPPPATLREPRAPRHGAGYDSFDPYPTRQSARLATRRPTDSHTTPPPPSPRKTRQRNLDIDTLSPPGTHSPRKKSVGGKARLVREASDLDSSDLSDSLGSSLNRDPRLASALPHSRLLPTPVKTPRHKKSHTDLGSTARSLFPGSLSTSSNSKRPKKPSGFSLDSFQEDSISNHNSIEIFTDSRDRIPTRNDTMENPFLSKPEAKMTSNSRAKRRDLTSRVVGPELDPKEAVKRDDGMLYTFRGKKIFRKFENKNSDEEEANTDDELGFFAVRPDLLDSSVNLHVPRLTRSAIKGRRLFVPASDEKPSADETLPDSIDENEEEATTDIEEPVEASEATDIVHSEGDVDVPIRRSLRTRKRDDEAKTEPTHAAVLETKKRGKSSSPFAVWARKKQYPADAITTKKRDADAVSPLAVPVSKKTRGQ